MQCTHSNQLADVGMLQMNKAEAKRYEQENITIMSMIISSSHSNSRGGFSADFSGRVHSA